MKPLKLIISAFGSYADVQTVDFTELGNSGLYLITGNTGSGKTTIFDAISFALFGRASGDGRNDYQMLRSDFADEKTKTFVELDFLSGESAYNIKRTIKKNGQDAVIVLPDGTSIGGDRGIKSKIAEIIGLDRDQFAQIVMIAQNDFLRFLQSGTEERLKIMRRIFGTESLKYFEERLKSLVKSENDKRALILRDFERYDLDVYKRGEYFSEWETQIKTGKAELSGANRQIDIYDKKKQELAADIAVAEELYKKFSELAKLHIDYKTHTAKKEEISKAKKRADRGESALRKIKPHENEAQKANENHILAKADLKNAENSETTAEAELANAVKTMESLPVLDEARNAFANQLKEWETAADKLKNLMALQAARNDIADKNLALTKARSDLEAALDVLKRTPLISDYQLELDKTAADLNSEREKLAKLSLLQSDYAIIADRQILLSKEQTEFKSINAGFIEANKNYLEMEDAFLRSQAGILASGLNDGVPCPVCGSTDHPMPAILSDDHITEEKLKNARDIKDKTQIKREAKSSLCNSISVETEILIKRFISECSIYASGISVESAPTLLHEITSEAQAAESVLREKKAAVEKQLSELKTESETAAKKRDEQTPNIASLQGEIDTLKKRFLADLSVYVTKAEWEPSENALSVLLSKTKGAVNELAAKKEKDKKTLDDLSINWDTAIKRKTAAESAALSARTLTAERAANEQKLSKALSEAQAVYKAALRENNFTGDSEYALSLITEKELSELKRQISDYEKDGGQLERDIARLETETAGKKAADIENLRIEAEKIHIESESLGRKRDEINNHLSKTESALSELRRAAGDFEKVEKSYAAIRQLADTANGKLDFETFAQTAYFGHVLHAANLRLQLMSQNRYTLLRKTEGGDGRRRSGLELEVLDAYTGKARSANSLSGGESFMASLSLALGLSDVVQQNAGGIRIDAMFIDEGFGSLDTDVLELAVRTLSEMAGTNRIIGIISHVTELRERIERQIQVEKTIKGSRIKIL